MQEMEIQNHIEIMVDIQNLLLQFIDCDDAEQSSNNYFSLYYSLKSIKNQYEFKMFLRMLLQIANNHHHTSNFYQKIEKILFDFQIEIKEILSNTDIFWFFKSNNKIILFLIENKIMILNNFIAFLISKCKHHINKYKFFYQELKIFLDLESKHCLGYNRPLDVPENNEEMRKVGENESYISYLIRNDLVEEFISYINLNHISLSQTKIKTSIYETNDFLKKKQPSLIKYSAFFGSIQIFKFILKNGVKLKQSIWLYAIHGNCPDIIHLLEEEKVVIDDNFLKKCLEESIKCHHNDIAKYLIDKLQYNVDYQLYGIKNYNYEFITNNFDDKLIFSQLIILDYFTIINALIHSNSINAKAFIDYKSIHFAAKKNNYDIVNLIFPKNINIIKNNLFYLCKKLKKLIIPSSVTIIDYDAFYCCYSLEYVLFDEQSSLVSIENCSFERCESLKEIIIPSNVTKIGSDCFYDCSSLKKITLPTSIDTIFKNTFRCCFSLKQILIPSSVTKICRNAFCGCYSLEQVTFQKPSSLDVIEEYAFDDCNLLKKISIPPSVSSIGKSSFANCCLMEEICFEEPSSLLSIGEESFRLCCFVKQIEIPQSVSEIGKNAFFGCLSLECITISYYFDLIYIGIDNDIKVNNIGNIPDELCNIM